MKGANLLSILLLSFVACGQGEDVSEGNAALTGSIIYTEAGNNETQNYYTIQYSGTGTHFRVYIDVDQSVNTGFRTGGNGGDYLLENERLYRYAGTGLDWTWTLLKTVSFTNSSPLASWHVNRADLGETRQCFEKADVVFNVDSTNAAVVHHNYINPSSCVYTFQSSYSGTPNFFRAYLDLDNSASTGFAATAGVGAELMLEGASLYVYTGPPGSTTWSWQPVTYATVTFSSSGGLARWTLSGEVLSNASCSIKVVYQTQQGSTIVTRPATAQELCSGATQPPPAMKIAVPSYFYPGGAGQTHWDRLTAASDVVGIAIINPSSGPGASASQAFIDQVTRSRARGIAVLGYVSTNYGARDIGLVTADINRYYDWYAVDGIFFDEAKNDCNFLSRYQGFYNQVKGKPSGKKIVVLNPGATIPECFVSASDVMMNSEGTASSYETWHPMGWESKYPASRFWHVVYGSSSSNLNHVLTLARGRNVGFIFVTDDNLPNPWDTLGSYWDSLTSALR